MSRLSAAKKRWLRQTNAQHVEELEPTQQPPGELEQTVKGRENENLIAELFRDLNGIYKDAPVGLCYLDTDMRFVQINHWLAAINGLSIERHLGRTIGELFPEIAQAIEPHFRHVIETGKSIVDGTVEFETPAQPGVKRTFEHTYFAIRSLAGKIEGVSCFVQDITKRNQIQTALQKTSDMLQTRVDVRDDRLREAHQKLIEETAKRRQAATRFEALLEAAPDPTICVDQKGRIVTVNEEAERSFGYSREELIGQNLEILVPDRHRDQHIKHRLAYLRSPSARNMGTGLELTVRCKDGRELPVEISLKHMETAGEKLVIAAIRDITQRKEAEDVLRESKESLQLLIESTRAIPWMADDRTQQITYLGPQAENLLGYSREQWLEPGFWIDHIDPRDSELVRDFPANLPRGVDDYELEFRMIASDGQSVWFQSIIHVVRYDDKPVIRKGFSIDISARKRIEEALHNLSARLINAQEEERRRIARELHDDFSQRLALMSLDVELLARDQAEPSEAFDEHIHGLLDRIKDLSSDIHRLSHQLHPTTLIHLNLVKAIKSLCDELSALHNLRIDFVDQEVPDSLHDDLTLCLYRIVQEALTNIIKHSGSRKARVELTRSGANLKLCVRDWGVGFDVAKVGNKQGLGLISMRERLHLVNGKMAVESSEARGTQIEVLVPIAEPMPVDGN